ncbi:magnesium transporter [Sanguibacteroides justesenii]|uniref:Magnesium transporter MgtE n=1 Tax=Sanguibacteroides justesenii TaxID=1547597 RepID=A0A0C3R932_9PORP|nr:magnesium transporter [Sanguibacteroides justesenii]KIO46011.1 magnesium transporter [Sanguibacteroides justesenii]KIO47080.1 magnesium transporter [Sanguibacteroides justesenii]PXZ42728.1 magnesium transporter [Sanguibacteroides justesenii]
MQQFELTNEFLAKLEEIINAKDKEGASKIVETLHPADIAEILEELDNKQAQFLFLLLDNELAGDVLAELEEDERKRFIESFPPEIIAKRFIDNMDSDDAADLVGSMSDEQQHEVLSHIEDLEQAGDIVDLLHYDEDTAGGLMGKELVAVNENWTVLTCLRELSRQAENIGEIFYVYVVDDDNVLKGRLSLKKMILSPTSTKINKLYNPDVIFVNTDETAESVGRIMQKYDLVAIPVVDSIGRLVGRITIDDVVDVIREEAEKDYHMMSGITQDVESSDTIWDQTKARLPWLIIGLFGGMLAAYMISFYQADIALFPATAMFIPVITAMGGNVGIQSSAIVVKGLASNSLGVKNIFQNIIKEIGGALINATICSSIIFVLTLCFNMNSFAMPLTVTISLFTVIIFASLFGTAFPLLLNRINIDPALATGPFITLTNDIIGLNIYLFIGKLILAELL